MGQRYNVHFKDCKNEAYDVKIYIEGYVGQVTELLGARSVFVVEGNDENFVYEPIRSSTATLTLLGNDYYWICLALITSMHQLSCSRGIS